MPDRSCLHCGGTVPPPKYRNIWASYCTKRCQNAASYLRRAEATAAYRAARQAAKAPTRRPCVVCGVEMVGRRRDTKFCSPKCSREGQAGGCSVSGCPLPFRAKGFCNKHYRIDRGEKSPWSDAKRDAYHRRRALKAGTTSGRPVILSEIRTRDRNRCHLCGKAVPEKAWPHPLSPSLDHVVPLSKGGEHDPANVRLAHLRCNVDKRANGGNEQLMLIG